MTKTICLFLGLILCSNQINATISNKNPLTKSLINYQILTKNIASVGNLKLSQIKMLKKIGFKTIIDLRTPQEGIKYEQKAAKAYGIDYLNIPISSSNIFNNKVHPFSKALSAAKKPVLFHCASGNRAGALWALYMVEGGVTPQKAIGVGERIGMRSYLKNRILEYLKAKKR